MHRSIHGILVEAILIAIQEGVLRAWLVDSNLLQRRHRLFDWLVSWLLALHLISSNIRRHVLLLYHWLDLLIVLLLARHLYILNVCHQVIVAVLLDRELGARLILM